MKRLAGFTIRLGLLGAATFATIELGLRLLQPFALQYYRDVKMLHVYHPQYLVGLLPNADIYIRHFHGLWEGRFTTNSLGYRGSPEPSPDRGQLACLGDSVVMGFGVSDEQTFCHLLGGVEFRGEKLQAMNLGVDAFGSLGSAKRLAEAAPKLNLKLALFFPSPNDFTMPDELRALGQLPDDDKDALRENDPAFRRNFRLQFEATRLSYTLHAIKLAHEQLKIRRVETVRAVQTELQECGIVADHTGKRANPLEYVSSAFYRSGSNRRCAQKAQAGAANFGDPATFFQRFCPRPLLPGTECAKTEPDPASLSPLPDVTVRAYRQMMATAKRNNLKLVVVLLPIQNEVLQCTQNGQYSHYFDFAIRLRRFFEKEGVSVIDIRPYVKNMCGEPIVEDGRTRPSEIRDYFIPADGHFTVAGNRWAAESIRAAVGQLKP